MTGKRAKSRLVTVAALVVWLAAAHSHSQTLTISLSANAVNFALVRASATNHGNTTVNVRTAWAIGGQNRTLTIYCYFANSASALTDGLGDNIPSSAFSISTNGAAFRPLTISEPFGGANAGRRIIGGIAITGTNNRTDNVAFNIDLSAGTLPQLPPGTYLGTLSIRAQAI